MKKSTTRLFSMALAVILTLMLAIPFATFTVSAAEPGTITITPPQNVVLDSDDFKAYKIFDLDWDGDNAYTYTLANEFSGFLPYDEIETEADLIKHIEDMVNNSAAINNFAADVWDYIDKKEPAITPIQGTMSGNNVEFSNLDLGYYLVYAVGETDARGEEGTTTTVVAACALKTNTEAVTIELKADAPTIEKDVLDTDDGEGEWKKAADAEIGDTVEFRLTSYVPKMEGYTSYEYIVHDTMSAGLTFDPDSVIVKINDVEITAYTVDSTPEDSHTFDIIFDKDYFATLTPGHKIEINYSATLNQEAEIATDANINTVYLEYSNDPYGGGTGETPEKEVEVYTYEIEIYKYTGDLNNNPTPLADAEFELRKTDNKDDPAIKFIFENGVYRVAEDQEDIASQTLLKSGSNGEIEIEGLDIGDYFLFETQAPSGYNKIDESIKIKIERENADADGEIILSQWGIDEDDDDKEKFLKTDKINVLNNTGSIFPETGGIGRTIFTIGGAGLMVIAGIALVMKLKMKGVKPEETPDASIVNTIKQ